MLSPFALELYADEVIRARRLDADQRALIAQLPHAPAPRVDLAIRLRAANALRALAIRLDPCATPGPALATATRR
ncbi:MAG: hypothetical protein M3069_30600 [Chloroflexota bacterium]|nr:hypothetical protein [Chloroflexota bacterium]